jgi:hypothetical protein
VESRISLHHSVAAAAGAYVVVATWRGDDGTAARMLQSMEGGPFPVTTSVVAAFWRSGLEDEARAHLEAHPVDLDYEGWFAPLNWGMSALVALLLGDAALGTAARARILPHLGLSCAAGSGSFCGPLDLYAALGAAAAGDLDQARVHADEAARLCEEWEIPLAGLWLRALREQHGF